MTALEVWDTGDPAGRPVVFLPGCPDSRWAAWPGSPVASRLGVRLVSVNRPGYGASPPGAVSDLSVAHDVVRTVDALGLDTFAVVGMSVGGVHALELAVRCPDRVSSVVTVSSPGQVALMDPPQHRDGLSEAEAGRLEQVRSGSTDDAVRLLRPEFEEWVQALRAGDLDESASFRNAEWLTRRSSSTRWTGTWGRSTTTGPSC